MNTKTVHILISGKVHGVFFRESAKTKADQLGIRGWIRNLEGDIVETVVSGEEPRIFDFIDWCKRGPEHAVVDNVKISEYKGKITENNFIIN